MILPGINIRSPWSELLASGQKTVETRTYQIPKKYVGKPLALIETPEKGKKQKSRVIAIITFGESFKYTDGDHFREDEARHRVPPRTEFSWEKRGGKSKWGWPVLSVERVNPFPPPQPRGIVFASRVSISN